MKRGESQGMWHTQAGREMHENYGPEHTTLTVCRQKNNTVFKGIECEDIGRIQLALKRDQ